MRDRILELRNVHSDSGSVDASSAIQIAHSFSDRDAFKTSDSTLAGISLSSRASLQRQSQSQYVAHPHCQECDAPPVWISKEVSALETRTDRILEKVESLSEFLQSIRIQTARLKHSIAEFESDNQTHGMWNLESPITESFAFSIITEKIEAIRTDLYSAKKEILGFLDNIYIFGGNYSADECDKTVERLAVFHKKRLAKDLVVCSETFKDVLDGMVARRKNLTNQMSEHSNENFSAPGRIWLSDNQMETNSEEIEKGLYLMIEKRNDLDGEQLREKELKTLEHGMCELVELFEEMRQFVVTQDVHFDTIIASVDSTDLHMNSGLQVVEKTVNKRRRSRIKCWWWTAFVVVLIILGITAVVLWLCIR